MNLQSQKLDNKGVLPTLGVYKSETAHDPENGVSTEPAVVIEVDHEPVTCSLGANGQSLDVSDKDGTLDFDPSKGVVTVTATQGGSLTLPAMSLGAGIIQAFLAMMKYLQEMQEQNFEMTKDICAGMLGTGVNGAADHKGILQSWAEAGMSEADHTGNQIMQQAIGALIGACIAGASVLATVGGFMRNSTNLGEAHSEASTELENLQKYRARLENGPVQQPEIEAGAEVELQNMQGANGNAANAGKVELDAAAQQRKQELIDGTNLTSYKAKPKGDINDPQSEAAKNKQTELAADHLTQEERASAVKEADKKIESANAKLQRCEQAQNTWTQFMNSISQAGSAAGNAYGGWTASDEARQATYEKTSGALLQNAVSTSESSKEKSTQAQQQNREQMGQVALSLGSILSSLGKA